MSSLPKVNNIKHTGLNESFDIAPKKYYGASYSENSKAKNKTPDRSFNIKMNYKGKLDPLNHSVGDSSYDSPQNSSTLNGKIIRGYNPKIQSERVGIEYFQSFALGGQKYNTISNPQPPKNQPILLNGPRSLLNASESGKKASDYISRGGKTKSDNTIVLESQKVLNEYNEDDNFDFGDIASEFYHRFMRIKEKDSKNPIRYQQKFAEKYMKKENFK